MMEEQRQEGGQRERVCVRVYVCVSGGKLGTCEPVQRVDRVGGLQRGPGMVVGGGVPRGDDAADGGTDEDVVGFGVVGEGVREGPEEGGGGGGSGGGVGVGVDVGTGWEGDEEGRAVGQGEQWEGVGGGLDVVDPTVLGCFSVCWGEGTWVEIVIATGPGTGLGRSHLLENLQAQPREGHSFHAQVWQRQQQQEP